MKKGNSFLLKNDNEMQEPVNIDKINRSCSQGASTISRRGFIWSYVDGGLWLVTKAIQ